MLLVYIFNIVASEGQAFTTNEILSRKFAAFILFSLTKARLTN